MRVFIANFGRENWAWPECKKRATIATMNDFETHPLWVAGDRETFVQRAMLGKTAAGITPTRPVASRWFNLMTVIAESAGDTWIHREKNELWWTTSLSEPPFFEEETEPTARGERVVVCHKPCEPWSDRNLNGNRLTWEGLHPKAREFLFTEGTLQELGTDNAHYALALLAGDADVLSAWHNRPAWKLKTVTKIGKGGPVTQFSGPQRSSIQLANQAFSTAQNSNGQKILTTMKEKNVIGFSTPQELSDYILKLIDSQEKLCTITGLPLQFHGEEEDKAMLCSLDRIDSAGHYEQGNLQVVCRFVNGWKSSGDDGEFRRLIRVVRSISSPDNVNVDNDSGTMAIPAAMVQS